MPVEPQSQRSPESVLARPDAAKLDPAEFHVANHDPAQLHVANHDPAEFHVANHDSAKLKSAWPGILARRQRVGRRRHGWANLYRDAPVLARRQ